MISSVLFYFHDLVFLLIDTFSSFLISLGSAIYEIHYVLYYSLFYSELYFRSAIILATYNVLILSMLFFVRTPVIRARYHLRSRFNTILSVAGRFIAILNVLMIMSAIKTFSLNWYNSRQLDETPSTDEKEESGSKNEIKHSIVKQAFHTALYMKVGYSPQELVPVLTQSNLNLTLHNDTIHNPNTHKHFRWYDPGFLSSEVALQNNMVQLAQVQRIAWNHSHATFLKNAHMAHNLPHPLSQYFAHTLMDVLRTHLHFNPVKPTVAPKSEFKPVSHIFKTYSYIETTYSVPELKLLSLSMSFNVTPYYTHLHPSETGHRISWTNVHLSNPSEEDIPETISLLTYMQYVGWTHSHATFLESIHKKYNSTYQPSQYPKDTLYNQLSEIVKEFTTVENKDKSEIKISIEL